MNDLPLPTALTVFAAAAAPRLVALDFDGSLAPLVDDPTRSRPLPRAAAALARLAALPPGAHTTVALVSGRNLADLTERAQPPVGTLLVGSHGAEIGHMADGGPVADPLHLDTAQQQALATLIGAFERIAATHAGAWVQIKPSAAVMHTRLARTDVARTCTEAALAVADRLELAALQGKDVVEVAVTHTSKGIAVERLRSHLGDDTRVLYAGDDTTDERALEVLRPGDVGIKVGPGSTSAEFRLADPAELAETLLMLVADLETTWQAGSDVTSA